MIDDRPNLRVPIPGKLNIPQCVQRRIQLKRSQICFEAARLNKCEDRTRRLNGIQYLHERVAYPTSNRAVGMAVYHAGLQRDRVIVE